MNIAIWIAIALVAFVLPAVSLTDGGKKAPKSEALTKHAAATGLPLTPSVITPVVERIRRRERGMLIGGVVAILACGLAAILTSNSQTWGPLTVVVAGAGTALGGAWALAAYRPSPEATTPVVARPRTTRLLDYLTPGERFGLWSIPLALVVGSVLGAVLLFRLHEDLRGSAIVIGFVSSAIALVVWGIAVITLRRVLEAPARSGSDLELAWDDAERAIGLRSLTSMAVAVSCFALALWGILMAQIVTSNGFYRAPETEALAVTLSLLTAAVFGTLIIVVAAGPVHAWITGLRKGYEQRRLWPNGW